MPELVFAYRKCGNRWSDHYEKREEDIKRQMKHVGYDFESWSREHGMWENVFREVYDEKEIQEKEKEKKKQIAMGQMTALEYSKLMNSTSDVQEKKPPTSLIAYLISFII